jgi:Sphingosine kinase and enzymes related to eukaryotic diacylglycerol kinase
MFVQAVLNRKSGTLRTADIDRLSRHIEEKFNAAGHKIACSVVDGAALSDALEQAFADDRVDCVIAGGGDGTVSGSAARAWKSGKVLGVLPAGTMNFYARTLKIPFDLEAAVDVLAAGEVEEADIATANGRPFIHQFSVGMQPRMVVEREKLDYGSRAGKILASLRAMISPLLNPPSFPMVMHRSGGDEPLQASLFAVSTNPHGEGHLPYPDTIAAGSLGVYLAGPLPTARNVVLAADIAGGRIAVNPDIAVSSENKFAVSFPKRKRGAKAVIDGELVPLDAEVKFEIHPRALRVLAPRPDAD